MLFFVFWGGQNRWRICDSLGGKNRKICYAYSGEDVQNPSFAKTWRVFTGKASGWKNDPKVVIVGSMEAPINGDKQASGAQKVRLHFLSLVVSITVYTNVHHLLCFFFVFSSTDNFCFEQIF